jgi:hypothetical protein
MQALTPPFAGPQLGARELWRDLGGCHSRKATRGEPERGGPLKQPAWAHCALDPVSGGPQPLKVLSRCFRNFALFVLKTKKLIFKFTNNPETNLKIPDQEVSLSVLGRQ